MSEYAKELVDVLDLDVWGGQDSDAYRALSPTEKGALRRGSYKVGTGHTKLSDICLTPLEKRAIEKFLREALVGLPEEDPEATCIRAALVELSTVTAASPVRGEV